MKAGRGRKGMGGLSKFKEADEILCVRRMILTE